MVAQPATGIDLLAWQREWLDGYQISVRGGKKQHLMIACPGAGKTIATGASAVERLASGQVEQLIVVVHRTNLRTQWAEALFKACRLNLDPAYRNDQGGYSDRCQGIVITYQQMMAAPLVFAILCSKKRTLVILDEVHHTGIDEQERLRWVRAIMDAFSGATLVLMLSGTPFRTDGHKIPFVEYGADGKAVADYTYSYGRAIKEGVCRPISFETWNGDFEWLSGLSNYRSTFTDDVPDEETSRRLRTALATNLKWLPGVLKRADASLSEMRREYMADAAGLVKCMDTRHANEVAAHLKRITGEPAVVVHSLEEGDSTAKLKAFKTSGDRWLVAVNMVTEGVDIPRLAMGVYASNVMTLQAFLQFVGRFVRRRHREYEPNWQPSWEGLISQMLIPDIKEIVGWAADVRDIQIEALLPPKEPKTGGGPRQGTIFLPIEAQPGRRHVLIDGVQVPMHYRDRAEQWLRENGDAVDAAPTMDNINRLAKKFFDRDGGRAEQNGDADEPIEEVSDFALKQKYTALRNTAKNALANWIKAAILAQEPNADFSGANDGICFAHVDTAATKVNGVKAGKHSPASGEQTKEQYDAIIEWTKEAQRARNDGEAWAYLERNWSGVLRRVGL